MNLYFATTTSILLGATGVPAEDASSILKGAISSTYTAISDTTQNLRGRTSHRRSSCDMYSPCPSNKFCKMDDGMCLSSSSSAAEDESSDVYLDESPPISGMCKKKPSLSVCFDGEDPEVCGCDGETYVCRQEAYRNGINVDYVGSCTQSLGRYIVNAGSPDKRAITIANGSCTPGTNIQLFHQVNGDHQKWIYHYDTGVIESVACPGMVLNIDGGKNSKCVDETNIILWHESEVEWEKWMYSPEGKIISMYCENKVLDIFNGNNGNGANIQLYHDTGGSSWNQKWSFE